MVRASLETYRSKRDFSSTPEPGARLEKGPGGRFVVHEHHASSLHFDLRLEMGGVLKSYAVPKGPSLDPKVRRLAVQTEDHPVKYLGFQGSIGDGQYGAGQMVIWDAGTYSVPPGEDPVAQWEQGRLHLQFAGEKLRGGFMLIRGSRGDRQWLLFKKKDEAAAEDWNPGLILPYGARSEKPPGFEIPAAALRSAVLPITALRVGKVRAAREAKTVPEPGAPSKTAAAEKPVRGSKTPGKARKWPVGAKASPLPDFIQPMLATLADKPFDDPAWVFESKWDGWRALMRADASGLKLISRSGKSLDAMFPELSGVRKEIRAGSCMLDGEIVALDAEGVPRFQLLQNRLKGRFGKPGKPASGAAPAGAGRIVYYAFDMPFCDGHDLTACGLKDRKQLLRAVLPDKPSVLRYSGHFPEKGADVFREAVRLGLEGVVAKRADGPYRKGRSADWVKIKVKQRQEVVIGGYTDPRGARALFGSLVVGLYRNGELHFAGHVGSGFDSRLLRQVHGFLEPLRIRKCPFAEEPKTNEKVQWVKPALVGEVEFAEWTEDGRMRQPIFLGLRPDKRAEECSRETALPAETVRAEALPRKAPESGDSAGIGNTTPTLTHPGKVLWPDEGYTKADLAAYYQAVSPWLLPHLKDRPLILKRFPAGIANPPFFQHDVKTTPAFVETATVEEEGGSVRYVLCQNAETLRWLANLGVIPMHPWLSRARSLERPDWIVFDLDPQDVPFPEVCGMALYLKEVLDDLGLRAFPKTSGSKGVHVYLPLKPAYDFGQALDFARLVGEIAVREKPDAFTMERSLKLRKKGRIYLDCMQNSLGKSVASAYSVRERSGATVSAPLEWDELKRKIRMEDFDIRTMPKRLARKGDLFQGVLGRGNSLEGALKKLSKRLL